MVFIYCLKKPTNFKYVPIILGRNKTFFKIKVVITIRFCAYLNTIRRIETLFVSALEINEYNLFYTMPITEKYTN
jgi:hypothetical protein